LSAAQTVTGRPGIACFVDYAAAALRRKSARKIQSVP
jgi:hypothetical protein